jgi:hypothetical protein
MKTTKAFEQTGRKDMSFLTKVGENVDIVSDTLLELMAEKFPQLTMTPPPVRVTVERDNNQHYRR